MRVRYQKKLSRFLKNLMLLFLVLQLIWVLYQDHLKCLLIQLQKWKNKVAGGFTNSGGLNGDKLSSILELVVLAGQHGMIWVSPGILPESPYAPENINRLGSYLGVMAQSNQGVPETTTASGDIKTAELYGRHIAEITEKLVK